MAFGPAGRGGADGKPLEMNARVRMLLVAVTVAVVLMLVVLALL